MRARTYCDRFPHHDLRPTLLQQRPHLVLVDADVQHKDQRAMLGNESRQGGQPRAVVIPVDPVPHPSDSPAVGTVF